MGLKADFDERWKAVLERFAKRMRNDDGFRILVKRHRKLLKKLREVELHMDKKNQEILAEEVKREFASK